MKKFTIGAMARECGIQPQTIRVWEKRYNAFSPERTDGGQRLYSENDFERAKKISKLISYGHSISKLARLQLDELIELVTSFEESSNSKKNDVHKKLLDHLNNYQLNKVVDELSYFREDLSVKDFIFEVVLPTMGEIGFLVANGTYTVTQEHIISTLIREQISRVQLSNSYFSSSSILIASPDGNLHEMPILIADLLCRANRVQTHYLGASHPAYCLAEAINALETKTLVLGAVSSDAWDSKKMLNQYLLEIDKRLENNLKVIVGGSFEVRLDPYQNITDVIWLSDFKEFDKYLKVHF